MFVIHHSILALLPYALSAALACGNAELIGYWLHRLFHSEWIPWLTRRHLIHHLEMYGPSMKMQTPIYRDRVTEGIAGIGWEWPVSTLMVLVIELAALNLLGIAAVHQAIILGGGTLWSLLMFYGAHEAMHVERPPWHLRWPLRRRFFRARRLHAIHHVAITEDGRFLGNFGIMFHGFDRLFGTYLVKVPSRTRGRESPPRGPIRASHGRLDQARLATSRGGS